MFFAGDHSSTLSSFSGDYHYDSDEESDNSFSIECKYEHEHNSPSVDDGEALPPPPPRSLGITLAYLLRDFSPEVRRRHRTPATPPVDDDEFTAEATGHLPTFAQIYPFAHTN